MSQHDPEYIDLCAAWALGCLDARDQVRLDQHVEHGCRECGMAMANFSAATVLVAASAPRVVPDPALRQRVLATASATASGGALKDGGAPTARPAQKCHRYPACGAHASALGAGCRGANP